MINVFVKDLRLMLDRWCRHVKELEDNNTFGKGLRSKIQMDFLRISASKLCPKIRYFTE